MAEENKTVKDDKLTPEEAALVLQAIADTEKEEAETGAANQTK